MSSAGVKYSVEKNETFGRYLAAKENIDAGEIIFRDAPLVVGPRIKSPLVCVACHRPPQKKFLLCKGCMLAPLCGESCERSKGWHTEKECEAFGKLQKFIQCPRLIESMHLLTILRCIILQETDKWEDFIKLESHMEARRNSNIWKVHESKAQILNETNLLTDEDKKNELVQKICGILDVNSFELRVNSESADSSMVDPVCGIYALAAIIAHNCVANIHLAIDDSYNMTVRASVNIKAGDPLYYNYTHALQGTANRKAHLMEGKYFVCKCDRCSDPVELGTHMSTIKCWSCRKFLLVLDGSAWKCLYCKVQFKNEKVAALFNDINRMYENTDKTETTSIEKFLSYVSDKLHPNHYIMLDTKQTLAGLLRDILDRSIQQQKKVLLRKIEICGDFLQIIDTIEPGISRLKAIVLYEIHIPIAVLANKDHDAREISTEELLKKLNEAKDKLKEAIRLLLYEPMASPEGRLCRRAMNDLKILQKAIDQGQSVKEN